MNGGLDPQWSALVGIVVVLLALVIVVGGIVLWRSRRQIAALTRQRDQLQDQTVLLKVTLAAQSQALEDASKLAERERDRVEAMFQDAARRIGNSLATVSSLLGLQMLRSESEQVKQALEAARSRVHAIASAHRRLRLGDDLDTTSAEELLESVLQDLSKTMSSSQAIALVSEVDAIDISARNATTLGIVIGELVSNALRHGFPDGRAGRVLVRLQRDSAGVPVLSVIDDGVGINGEFEAGAGGLGSVIVKQLAQQLGGVPVYERSASGGLSVTVPLPAITPTPLPD